MRHEPTYAGFYARHADSPPLGSNRVLLRTDPEFEVAMSVLDLLETFRLHVLPGGSVYDPRTGSADWAHGADG